MSVWKTRAMKIFFTLFFLLVKSDCSEGEECPSILGGCCSGFYRSTMSGNCTECSVGYYGINCSRICGNGYYGLGCLYMCSCQENEICNHEVGCIRYTETTAAVPLTSSIITELSDTSITTIDDKTMINQCEVIYTPDPLLSWKSIILIGILSVSVALNIILTFKLRKHKCTCLAMKHSGHHNERNADYTSGYDVIDEIGIQRQTWTETNMQEEPQSDNDIPGHQQSEIDPSEHYFHTTEGVASNIVSTEMNMIRNARDDNMIEQNTTMETTSSNSSSDTTENVPSGDTGEYLNPYQPLQPEWQKHTHIYANTQCTKDYLNFLQLMRQGYTDKATQTEFTLTYVLNMD